ncbi:MAG: hypothetical protein P1U32_05375 [Legionellaceae bacterium]|nr:hypothetical protein [Legionellaceae bacterium]
MSKIVQSLFASIAKGYPNQLSAADKLLGLRVRAKKISTEIEQAKTQIDLDLLYQLQDELEEERQILSWLQTGRRYGFETDPLADEEAYLREVCLGIEDFTFEVASGPDEAQPIDAQVRWVKDKLLRVDELLKERSFGEDNATYFEKSIGNAQKSLLQHLSRLMRTENKIALHVQGVLKGFPQHASTDKQLAWIADKRATTNALLQQHDNTSDKENGLLDKAVSFLEAQAARLAREQKVQRALDMQYEQMAAVVRQETAPDYKDKVIQRLNAFFGAEKTDTIVAADAKIKQVNALHQAALSLLSKPRLARQLTTEEKTFLTDKQQQLEGALRMLMQGKYTHQACEKLVLETGRILEGRDAVTVDFIQQQTQKIADLLSRPGVSDTDTQRLMTLKNTLVDAALERHDAFKERYQSETNQNTSGDGTEEGEQPGV